MSMRSFIAKKKSRINRRGASSKVMTQLYEKISRLHARKLRSTKRCDESKRP